MDVLKSNGDDGGRGWRRISAIVAQLSWEVQAGVVRIGDWQRRLNGEEIMEIGRVWIRELCG